MPIYPWPKAGAILITKAARYVVPAAIGAAGAAIGAFIGWVIGKKRQEGERGKRKR